MVDRTSSQNQYILELELKNTSKKSMPTYNEVLTQVQRLALSDQLRLLEELRKIVHQGVEVEGDDEVVSAQEIAESQAALADYFAGRDRGISSKELKLKLRQSVIPHPKRSILELEGLGKEIWNGIDAGEYVNQERDSWNG